jgi:hypothetical protein
MSNENTHLNPPDNQQERWLKYGGNVALASVIVIVLAGFVVYIAQTQFRRPIDTTAGGLYSLKPQTLSVIKENKQPITIISLFTKAKQTGTNVDESTEDAAAGATPVDKPGTVADLLDEYRSQGSHITTETIDPDLNPAKAEDLVREVEKQYGGEIDKYKSFTDALPGKYDTLIKQISDESELMAAAFKASQGADLDQYVQLAAFSIEQLPARLKREKSSFADDLKLKVPDYKKVTDSASTYMQEVSDTINGVSQIFDRFKDDKSTPQPLRDYMAASLPRYAAIKKQADDMVATIKGLGDLKLDTLRDALKQKNCILVRGEKEWRMIPYEKIWKTDSRKGNNSGTSTKAQFAGEQMITTAILGLNQPAKTKVCFVRAGGPPITDDGSRLNAVAERLKDYNFEVSEKDLSGMWAMQAMQQQMPAAPEPSDQEIDDAVWVVDAVPGQSNPMMGGPPPGVADKVAEHLEKGHHWVDGKKVNGGNALVMLFPNPDSPDGENASRLQWSSALRPWGINPRINSVAMHQFIESEGEPDNNIVNAAQHNPAIFTFTEWGNHEITKPIQGLMGLLIQAVPIEITHVDGVTCTQVMPVPGAPNAPECFGKVNPKQTESHPKFDKSTDIPPPLFAGAVAEKAGARLVCVGSYYPFTGSSSDIRNDLLDLPDQELLEKKHMYAPQFPGDAEFFMNSMFWLSHQETMIAISPSAMNISRIGDIKPSMLGFWHIGVLLIGLPGLVVLAGAMAYYSRQD